MEDTGGGQLLRKPHAASPRAPWKPRRKELGTGRDHCQAVLPGFCPVTRGEGLGTPAGPRALFPVGSH